MENRKILIIEDTKSIIEELSTILSYENYTVLEARDGRQGMEVAIKELPDLIISDILMPVVNGYTLKENLGKNPLTENIPFIFLTAKTSPEELRKGMNLGADDYLTKPFSSHDIITSVKSQITKYERLKSINQEKIEELTSELEIAQQLSQVDPLTGAANRRGFLQKAEIELSRAKRRKYPLTFAYFDLDNFKYVNDTFGHNAGDIVLKKITECTVNNIRVTDIFARLGGDEFTLLIPEADNEISIKIINRINDCFLEIMSENGWPVTLSIGIITFKKLDLLIPEMLSLTDKHMYKAKTEGKNKISSEIVD
jgi:diguanylate cyclase (GGDEF)-like protein